eukprot:3004960-Prymnesium_polylepis.4
MPHGSTMRCIAERLLPAGHERAYLQKEIVNEKIVWPPPTKSYHDYCSPKNPGAMELLQEFVGSQGLALKVAPSRHAPLRRRSSVRLNRRKRRDVQNTVLHVTQDVEQLGECDSMLVYLTAQTWTRAEASSELGVEVGRAIEAGVPPLLVHEMIGVGGQEKRFGFEFAKLFSCDDGATPLVLIERGIYATIAVALKGGECRVAQKPLLGPMLSARRMPTSSKTLRRCPKLCSRSWDCKYTLTSEVGARAIVIAGACLVGSGRFFLHAPSRRTGSDVYVHESARVARGDSRSMSGVARLVSRARRCRRQG